MIQTFEPITYRDDLSRYLINRDGDIYSLHTNKTLIPQVDKYGYLGVVVTTDDGKRAMVKLHIAVARQFIPNDDPEHKTQVNHKDEDKHNPAAWNLEWTTPKGNSNHGTRNSHIKNSKHKPINEYDLDGHFIRTWASTRSVVEFYADFFGKTIEEMRSCEQSIYMCLKGKSKTSMNRVWRYYDGNISDIEPPSGTMNMVGIDHSPSKTRFDFDVCVPAEYLHHEELDQEIYNYFMTLDKLTDHEKAMFEKIFQKQKGA